MLEHPSSRPEDAVASSPAAPAFPPAKRRWVAPTLHELPLLDDLTLQTGSPIPGTGGPGGLGFGYLIGRGSGQLG